MKKIFLFLFFAFVSHLLEAQNANTVKISESKKVDGTYQVQVINSRDQPNIPGNIEELVIKNRNATNTVFLSLGSNVRLMILSTQEISKKEFKPLPQIGYVAE